MPADRGASGQGEPSRGQVRDREVETAGSLLRHFADAASALASDRDSGDGQVAARGRERGACDRQKQSGPARRVRFQVAASWDQRRLHFRQAGCGDSRRTPAANRSGEGLSSSLWNGSDAGAERLRSRRERQNDGRGIAKNGRREGRDGAEGKGQMAIAEEDRKEVMSQRGQTEGSIGTLKRYGFSGSRERSNQTMEAAGQRAMVCLNLNKLMRDLTNQEKQAQMATS